VGGAALYSHLSRSRPGSTTIYQDKTPGTAVTIRQADGATPMSLSEIYAAYADSSVCITVKTPVQQGWYQYEASNAGSGFIISEDGYIVTNYHVIEGGSSIRVTLHNGEEYPATFIGGEELNDVAVIKIEGVTGLKPVVLGDSDRVVVGETVCTIGNALGTLSFSQTAGAVSATGRSVTFSDKDNDDTNDVVISNMIQTDCVINSGNSGGPLFDSYGRVVGIVSAKYSNNGNSNAAAIEGIGFAIPINDVIGMVKDFMEYGYVTGRPYMGITGYTVTEEDVARFGWPYGSYVNSVEPGSCAERAGLRMGDIITAVGGQEVKGIQEVIAAKNRYRAGDSVELTVYRAGEQFTVSITFDEQGSTQTTAPAPQQGGQSQQGQNGQQNQGGGFYYDPWGFFPGLGN
jgi:serine protease Do